MEGKREFPLEQAIAASRNIKPASLKTYLSALIQLKRKIEPNEISRLIDTSFLSDFDNVMKVIDSENKITSKKNKLTAILVALKSDENKDDDLIKKYTDVLKDYGEKYTHFLKKQEKTDTQNANWISYDELIGVANRLMEDVKHYNLKAKETLTKKECDMLQQLVVIRTYIAFPLRNDFADMRVVTGAEYKDLGADAKITTNYLVIYPHNKKQFHINQYKNERYLGAKTLDVKSDLNRIINLWLKFNKSGFYLIRCDNKTAMNPNGITKYLNKIFAKFSGKKISTSMIRHIIISHELEGQRTIAEEDARAKKIQNTFLHSKEVNDLYRKVDKPKRSREPTK